MEINIHGITKIEIEKHVELTNNTKKFYTKRLKFTSVDYKGRERIDTIIIFTDDITNLKLHKAKR